MMEPIEMTTRRRLRILGWLAALPAWVVSTSASALAQGHTQQGHTQQGRTQQGHTQQGHTQQGHVPRTAPKFQFQAPLGASTLGGVSGRPGATYGPVPNLN